MDPQPLLDPITQAALRSLRDIATPPPVTWWPQTWGWAVVALLLAVAVALWALTLIRRYRRDAYRREALRLLDEIEPKILHAETRRQAVEDLASVLKRAALAAWPRGEVASLSGGAWVRFLDQHGGDFAGQALERLLDDFEYRASVDRFPSIVWSDIIASARTWIERHDVSA
ncbi:DUF4381 domain-containing protein [Rhizobium laguerreae]|uniref:DUF4381 domain-containing protein n=1 Tax=Rhizobium laguerreae TaxID=1076926 RepID=UPI0010402E27|nr:DUF4381 domain-containing protein [Rhizobium laguerreae]TBY08169.1 DUF4381 domain-containing protein [Rhizobium laguerreae]